MVGEIVFFSLLALWIFTRDDGRKRYEKAFKEYQPPVIHGKARFATRRELKKGKHI
jgi:hypothetical protein